jgi:hypothetical protein
MDVLFFSGKSTHHGKLPVMELITRAYGLMANIRTGYRWAEKPKAPWNAVDSLSPTL